MDALIGAINNPLVLLLVQLGFGALVKKWSVLASWPNKLIPVFNLALAVLVKLAGPGEANAGLFSAVGKNLLPILVESVAQTLIATGVHSSGKNIWQSLIKTAAKRVVSGG